MKAVRKGMIRHRLGALAALSAVGSTLLVGVPAGPAQAAVPCPPRYTSSTPASTSGTYGIVPGHVKGYTLISAVPTFNVSDARSVDNGLDSPISTTFTSQQSKTYTVSTSAGTTASLMGFLTANVSATITQSRTTSIGVSSTVTVPAHSRVLGEYGVDAYIVTYDVQDYWTLDFKKCNINGSPVRETRNAPTIVETWRFRLI